MSVSSVRAAYKVCELSEWRVTNLQVQKILYLAHMAYLGKENVPLIEEDFEASMFGPVLPKLYGKLKIFGSSPIPSYFFSVDKNIHSVKEERCLVDAWEHLRNKKNWELVGLTHRMNGAWAKVYNPNYNNTIPPSLILEEYRDLGMGAGHQKINLIDKRQHIQ